MREACELTIPQTPITRRDVDTALFSRKKVCDFLPDAAEQLKSARVVMWNWFAFMECCGTFEERVRSSPYAEVIDGDEKIVFKPPYLDRYHFFIEPPQHPILGDRQNIGASGESSVFFAIAFLWVEQPDDIPLLKIVQAWIDGGVMAMERTYNLRSDDSTPGTLYYMFEVFMQSRYTHIQQMRPENPAQDRRDNGGRQSDVIAVIARRPEKVHDQAERKLREEAIREGKRWILGHESHVEGHWRNQWYPSTQSHRTIFIPDFVRGKGKPMRTIERVTKVVR